jgi:hypothetical protein
MTPPPGASARDLFHVGVNRLVSCLDGYVSVVRREKRFPLAAIDRGDIVQRATSESMWAWIPRKRTLETHR